MKELLFPTTIHYYDNLLEPEYVDSMLEFIEKDAQLHTLESHQVSVQSASNLHNNIKFKALTEKVMILSKVYFEEMKWQYTDYEITDMWSTLTIKSGFHRPHNHSNNILSGVYYVKSDENANIVFADPRPQAHVLEPKVDTWQLNNAPNWSYPSTVNRLILFPSYLTHHVPVNLSNQNRISIAFNLMFKGRVGDSLEYQSANF